MSCLIDLQYNFISEIKSQILYIKISGPCNIQWHCLDNEGDIEDAFYQTKIYNEDDLNDIVEELQKLFTEKQIPTFLLSIFLEHIKVEN
jgi:hypothetical protein